jgi:hypothetical protein
MFNKNSKYALSEKEKRRIESEERYRAQIKTQEKNRNTAIGCFLLIVLIFLLILGSKPKKNNSNSTTLTPSVNTPSVEKDESTMALIISQGFMKKQLTSPGTAKFAGIFDEQTYNKLNDGTYYVASFVDSQNGFGALIRTNYSMHMRFLGGDSSDSANWKILAWTVDGKKIF